MFDCRSSRSCLAPVRIGIGPHPGCFAELFVLPESILVPIPPNIRDYDAVMATDLSLAVAVVARVPRPARILVSGRGAEALALAAGLLADGLSLFVRAPHEPHMDLLSWHGIRRDPGGVFPLVVDCSGDSASAAASLARVEPGGVCVLVAAADLPLLVDARPVALSGVTVVGIAERPLAASLARLADDSLCQMLSKVRRTIFALDEAEQAFEAMARPGTLKVLLDNIGLRPGRSRR
jgi:threonine dehydrogenase-like Zn-dependent dehydrogenase